MQCFGNGQRLLPGQGGTLQASVSEDVNWSQTDPLKFPSFSTLFSRFRTEMWCKPLFKPLQLLVQFDQSCQELKMK
jgi:hypothetical protein